MLVLSYICEVLERILNSFLYSSLTINEVAIILENRNYKKSEYKFSLKSGKYRIRLTIH